MVDPGVLLIGGAGLSASAALVASVRTWRPREYVLPAVYTPDMLGLERFPPRGVLAQYSSPYSSACRVSLNRLAAAVAPHRDEAVVIEMHAFSAGVRTVPTVLFINPEGRVKRLWLRPPERAELSELLELTTLPPAARCSPAGAR